MHKIHSFLGLASYYRQFVEGFSSLFGPHTALTKKDVKFIWSDKCKKTFLELEKSLTTSSVLTLSKPHKPYVVYSEASKLRLRCVLMQKGWLVTYASSQLKDHEQNYLTHD